MKKNNSPCVNNCILKSNVCIGCGRTIDEIKEWSNLSEEDKIFLIETLKKRKENDRNS